MTSPRENNFWWTPHRLDKWQMAWLLSQGESHQIFFLLFDILEQYVQKIFPQWWKISISAVSNAVATSNMWLLSTWNVVSALGELNFIYSIWINLSFCGQHSSGLWKITSLDCGIHTVLGLNPSSTSHQIAEGPSASHSNSLGLSFLICKMGLLMPLPRFVVRITEVWCGTVHGT